MLLLLQLLENSLDIISSDVISEREISAEEEVISLDNFSEGWLVSAVSESLEKEAPMKIIILRRGNAEFQNLQRLINQLPQLKEVKILFAGQQHALLERMKNFRNISLKTVNDKAELLQEYQGYFTS